MRALRLLVSLPALLAACAGTSQEFATIPPDAPPDERRQLNFGIGPRSFEDEDFGRLDDHVAFTLDYCEPMGLRRVRLEGGFAYSNDEGDAEVGGEDVNLDAHTYELSLGANWSHLFGRVRPFAGAGASVLWLEKEGVDDDLDLVFEDEDTAVGGYAKAGVLFEITPRSHVGIEFRHFEGGDASFDGTELETSYDQVVLILGTGFVTAYDMPPHPLKQP